eukprot:CAMPEP_0168753632 /NCGR_PEP_ID=MMETSP0724-20121128/19048_1 /TAXON_ID=265536 /ORGANISM="Amphiprora sp., Strain CCMP467" /LENGTH=457 /DNA_ID=CAMNT_0008802011 /DNA_START=6 /DNA_END=1379 /DNA_ORIENTATION=-
MRAVDTKQSEIIDHTRYFPNSLCRDAQLDSQAYLETARNLESHCQSSLRAEEAPAPASLGSLYCGNLGAFVYLPWRRALSTRQLALTTENHSPSSDAVESRQMLERALFLSQEACTHQLQKQKRQQSAGRRNNRVTLLESPYVGAKVMEAVLLYSLEKYNDASDSAQELISWLGDNSTTLSPNECEVLYGRAGAIHAILFLRRELHDENLGSSLVLNLACDIIEQGKKVARQVSNLGFPLLWRWHDKFYLGAAHGLAGILQTLLCLNPPEREQLDQKHDMLSLVRQTIDRMNSRHCFPSSNLDSSIKEGHPRKSQSGRDRLVHFCHGAVGHVLLLAQAASVYNHEPYRLLACDIAKYVICPRGLLRKGVGLCHGISGNSYALLILASQADNEKDAKHLASQARLFAEFALKHLPSLESVPDRPYSLYEGVGGLCALCLDLMKYSTNVKVCFPLYAFN